MEMPSQEEQAIAQAYVLDRLLNRPNTDARKAIMSVVIYLLSSLAIGITMLCLFSWLGIFAYLPDNIFRFKENYPGWFRFLFVLAIYVVIGLLLLRPAAIGCVRLYQHYASEDLRRRCLFKPTCSEYAILAIKKYGLIIGLIKIYIRLFYKCSGNIYRIDYP